MEEKFIRVVKYVGGSACYLQYPLKDGRDRFESGVAYEITDLNDFDRLVRGGGFVDVTPIVEPIPPKDSTDESILFVEEILDDPKPKKANKGGN